MKDLFPGYYRPTDAEFAELWKTATFVFDANVLLHIHRRNKQTRRTILDTIKQLGDRLWVPFEVAAEYQRNKLGVAHKLVETCDPVLDGLRDVKKALEPRAVQDHPFLDAEALSKDLDALIARVTQARDESRRVSVDDAESTELASLLHGRIDAPYVGAVLNKNRDEAKVRIKEKIPPGYEDAKTKKDEGLAAGDVLIWFKMLDRAKETKRPIIFVTDDAKEDWWLTSQGLTYGPRPELRQEMWTVAQQRFYMYKLSTFLEHVEEHLGQKVPEEVVKEVQAHEQAQTSLSPTSGAARDGILHRYRELASAMQRLERVRGRILNTLASSERAWTQLPYDDFIQREIEHPDAVRTRLNECDSLLHEMSLSLEELRQSLSPSSQ